MPTTNQDVVLFSASTSNPEACFYNTVGSYGCTNIPLNAWTQIGWTYDGLATVIVYVNGIGTAAALN